MTVAAMLLLTMTWRSLLLIASLGLGGIVATGACAAGGGATEDDGSGAGPQGGAGGTGNGVGGEGAGFNVGGGSGGSNPNEITEVYGHSPDTLYVLVPETLQVSVVANFNGGCEDVVDIAIDEDNEIIATTQFDTAGLYRVNKQTATCTLVSLGDYPNSLSYVPAGTLDPDEEALVGYNVQDYVRIDPVSGNVTVVNAGALTGQFESSGDIVSVKNGGTFLTIKGGGCDDCIVEINPATGTIIQDFGDAGASQIFGLAYWGGTAYGFTNGGALFAIDFMGASVTATPLPIPDAPAGLKFWGAGSSTSVPVQIPE